MSFYNSVFFIIWFTINLNYTVSSDDNFESRVIGGFNCNITKYPFIVTVITSQICGGSLFTLEWVLTAAHCIQPDFKPTDIRVRAGFNSDKKYIQYRNAKEVALHKKYHKRLVFFGKDRRYDIALILLEKPFSRSPVVQPGQLPEPGFTKTCKTVRTAGIGRTYPFENSSSIEQFEKRPLKCVDFKIVNNINCSYRYTASIIDDSMICTLGEGRNLCGGDSGSPIFCKNVIIGIVSGGSEECKPGDPGLNTKIESYLNFISENVIEYRSIEKKTSENLEIATSINPRQQYSTSTYSTSTKKISSGSSNLQESLVKPHLNILFTLFSMYFFV